uniref:Uncharacterized protein n=1 Tax=Anguilla anguilla TaxID=7936 RepID=A0A0E9W3P7_ANGAN
MDPLKLSAQYNYYLGYIYRRNY